VIRRTVVALGAAFALAVVVVAPAAGAGIAPAGTTGIDVSYPNCNDVASMSARFGVVGVTGGVPYTRNPCLAAEAARFPTLHLYANAAWNARSPKVSATTPRRCATTDLVCRAYNYGYGAGLDALAAATAAGARSSVWWLDIEAANPWSGVVAQNRASIQGEYDALRSHGVATVGIYSTTVQWNGITGSWLNGWPSWGATVLTSLPLVRTYCTGHRFTGGQTWMIQYRGGSFDQNVACAVASPPSAPRSLAVGFPQAHVARATWAAPASPGAGGVRAYVVRWSTDAGRTWTRWTGVGVRRSADRTGIAKGRACLVQVRAVNAVGASTVAARAFRQGR
jgi:hypothetical protein